MQRFRKFRLILRIVRYTILSVVVLVALVLAYAYATLPKTGELDRPAYPPTLTIRDSAGRLLGFLGSDGSSRSWLPISRMPVQFLRLAVFLEDAGFWHHRGIDLHQIYHALLENIAFGKMKYGASTITQQLAKNVYLSSEKTLLRKIKELMLALILENRLSKQAIMEWYLNIVEMAPGVYGLRAGSMYHFGMEPQALSFPQLLYLASIFPAPAKYSVHTELLRQKMRNVAKRLRKYGRINIDQLRAVNSFRQAPLLRSLARDYPGLAALCRSFFFAKSKTASPGCTGAVLSVYHAPQLLLEKFVRNAPAGEGQGMVLALERYGRMEAAVLLPPGKQVPRQPLPPEISRAGYTLKTVSRVSFSVKDILVRKTRTPIRFSASIRSLESLKHHAGLLPAKNVKK